MMPPLAARDDAWIQREIVAELALDPSLAACEIGVAVRAGVVTLSGSVDKAELHDSALQIAGRIDGVRSLADEVRVLGPGVNRTDTELAHSVVKALDWEQSLPLGIVKSRVDEGRVWLTGTVANAAQRAAAERAVGFLTGVKGITNELKIREG